MWLLTNWKLLASAIALSVAFAAGLYVESRIAESRLEKAMAAQEKTLIAECQKDKAITKGISDEFQNKNAALNRRVIELKRMHPSACIVPTPNSALGNNASTGGAVAVGSNGVTTDTLFEFAEKAERYRLQLISCQDFIKETWKAKESR